MKLSKTLKVYFLFGLILSGIAGGIIGFFLEKVASSIPSDDILSGFLFGSSIVLCILILKDVRDKKDYRKIKTNKKKIQNLIYSEFRSVWQEVCSTTTRLGLFAYFLWATSQYVILILFADFQVKYTLTVIMMMSGYFLGVTILGFCKQISDERIIRIGFLLTIGSFISFFTTDFFVTDNSTIITISSFFYTIGNAFLSPSMLSLFSKERTPYNQGKGFGLIVSADTSGFLLASIIVILVNRLSIKLEYVFAISFICFLISWFPYMRYEKKRKNVTSQNQITL